MEDAEYPARRLGPIQSAAERVCPKSLTTEPAERLKENFDGIWSCACLYHLTKAEFRVCLESFHRILNPGGMVFVNLKLGTGERFIETPRDGYPGGAAAREKLGGDRFYSFYTRDELSGYFAPFTIERERRDLLKEGDGAMEFWLRKERPSGRPFGRQRPGGSAAR